MKAKMPKGIKFFAWVVLGLNIFFLFVCSLVFLFIPSIVALFNGSDCFSYVRYVQSEIEGKETFYWDNDRILTVTNGVISESTGTPPESYYEQPNNVAVWDSSFARRKYRYEGEGYEGVISQFTNQYVKNSVQAYSIYAIEYDNENKIAYGFFNLYSRTVGCLSGGGNSNTSKSLLGVYFSYSAISKQVTVIQEVNKGCMVACGTEGCVYVQNRKFYVKPQNRTATFLCDNIAYNKTYGWVKVQFSQNAFYLHTSHEKQPFKKAHVINILGAYDGTVYLKEKM